MNTKEKQIIGAINYIVLVMAYKYSSNNEFSKAFEERYGNRGLRPLLEFMDDYREKSDFKKIFSNVKSV